MCSCPDEPGDGSLSEDPIRKVEAVASLAGRQVPCTDAAYARLSKRLDYAVERGELKLVRPAELVDQRRSGARYSRVEIEVYRLTLESAGINGRAAGQRRHVDARPRLAGEDGELVSAAKASELTGRAHSTVRYWGPRGKYGARMIGNAWFFPRDRLPARRAPYRPLVTLPCAGGCGKSVKRSASAVERSVNVKFYCSECFPAARAELLRQGAANAPRPSRKPKQSAAMLRRWAEGKYDKDAHAERMKDTITTINKSPKKLVDRIESLRVGRGLASLTPAQRDELATKANQRSQADSPAKASAEVQGDRAAEKHAQGWEVAEIADEQHVVIRTVKRWLKERGRSERSPGRREAKQRRRIVKHLEQTVGNVERRDLQRATNLSARELGDRLHELGADVFDVNGRACVALVS